MLTSEQIQRLLDIANAGCSKGHVVEARVIYQGLLAANPGLAPATIGMALSHIVVNEFAEAEKLLRDTVLAVTPDDQEALAMLGLCHTLAGQREAAEGVLAPLVDQKGPRAELAAALLERARA